MGRSSRRQRSGPASSRAEQQMRMRIAEEAARILAAEQARGYHMAKQKAALRLGAGETRNLPSNEEVEAALLSYQRLFNGESHAARLRALREAALESMRFFQRFSPRLVGSVLQGTATEHADVHLHLFAETAEEVELFLMEQRIPFDRGIKRFIVGDSAQQAFPVLSFLAEEIPFELTVFPSKALRQAPRLTPEGSPLDRANIATVEALLSEPSSDS